MQDLRIGLHHKRPVREHEPPGHSPEAFSRQGDHFQRTSRPLLHGLLPVYRACPWNIRIPEVIRALREELATESPFEKAFKSSLSIWGRVYEPYVLLKAIPFLIKGGYIKHMSRWMEYMGIHLPHKVKGR